MGRKKVNKRGNSEGSIRLRKDGRYEARVTLGFGANGKQIQKSFYGKERKDVVQKMNDAMMNLYNGTYVEESGVTLESWINKYLDEYAKHKLKGTSLENYKIITKTHIVPMLGRLKLTKIKTSNIQTFINELSKKGLSAGSIRGVVSILRCAIRQAVKEKIIANDVTKDCVLPKRVNKEMNILNLEHINVFLDKAKKDRFYVLFLLELSTGLRRGEILGLRWKDINFEDGYIKLQQQVVKLDYKVVIQNLKTEYSNRKVYISQNILNELEKHNKIQKIQMIKNRKTWNNFDLVFTNIHGGVLSPGSLLRSFKNILSKCGLEDLRFHDLRHTYALNCLRQGIDIKTLQEQLGHHNASFTIQRYGHSTAGMKKDAANKMGDFLNQYIK
jgi:integrase